MTDLVERLRRKPELKARPTIAELEAILATPQAQPVTINPDGTVGTGYINPDGPEAADRIETLEAEITRLQQAAAPFAAEGKPSGIYLKDCQHRLRVALRELGNQSRVRMCEPKDE